MRKAKNLICVLLFVPLLSQAATNCLEQATSTLGMRNCIAKENRIADQQLNAAFTHLLSLLPISGQQQLRTAQRAWLSFRKNECTFAGFAAKGGTLAPLLIDNCYLELNKKRSTDLEAYLKEYQ